MHPILILNALVVVMNANVDQVALPLLHHLFAFPRTRSPPKYSCLLLSAARFALSSIIVRMGWQRRLGLILSAVHDRCPPVDYGRWLKK
jgi:hypothetical protein